MDKDSRTKLIAVKSSYYLSLQPPFVVNFEDQSYATYLQVEMQVMAHNRKVLKEHLQKSILKAIQKVVDQSEQ